MPPSVVDAVIIGAGASGLMCALTAAQRGRSILVLERSSQPGKKILLSGGGRCNFTNLDVRSDNYLSNNPHFCKSALSRFTQWDFIALVQQHGIAYEERKQGQLFCLHSSKDILDMLLRECRVAGVEIKTRCEVKRVDRVAGSYQLQTSLGLLSTESLVVATGALSFPSMGATGFGYELAQQFGLRVIPRRAGLVPFTFSDAFKMVCKRLSGVSVRVELTVGQITFGEDILFTHRGLSGPAVLRASNHWREGEEIVLNLLPDLDLSSWLIEQKSRQPRQRLRTLLSGHLTKGLVMELQSLFWPDLADRPIAEYSDRRLLFIADTLHAWRLKPSGTEGYRTAEVTLGGVDTDELNSRTMVSRSVPGLYFIGEVVDVTGDLGGFNFQWAWASGYAAGQFV